MTPLHLLEPASAEPFLDRIQPYQIRFTDPRKCEAALQFGIFFDGTGNNFDSDEGAFAHSNIARLSTCYPRTPLLGTSRLYVPGVGTDFDAIDSTAEGWRGTAFGVGCEARVLYGLLKTLDFIHEFIQSGKQRYSKGQLRVLCKRDKVQTKDDLRLIQSLGTTQGLQECGDNGAMRRYFLSNEATLLKGMLSTSKVKVTELVIDIFGFSRGAASARAYASWLNEILVNGRLVGIPLTIRFMGLFDTVASAGISEMILDGITNKTGGHNGWARAQCLRIPKNVVNCVHFVAVHELRKNFPVDAILVDDERPSNFHEFAYPGSHSDVGGGYAPGELGVLTGMSAVLGDAMKLSQIPLNHLFAYAVAGFVPLKRYPIHLPTGTYDPFAISPQLRRDFTKYVEAIGRDHRTLKDWMEAYLAWRWQIRDKFPATSQARNAVRDRELLLAGNRKLIADAELLLAKAPKLQAPVMVKDLIFDRKNARVAHPTPPLMRTLLDAEAPEVLRRVMRIGPPPPALTEFFEKYVHDSYAGFIANFMEPTGYWRYRKGFRGSDTPLNVELDGTSADIKQMS